MQDNGIVIAVTVAGAAVIIGTAYAVKTWKPIVIKLEPPRRRDQPPALPPPPEPRPDIVPLPDDLTPVDPPIRVNLDPEMTRRYFGGASARYAGSLR